MYIRVVSAISNTPEWRHDGRACPTAEKELDRSCSFFFDPRGRLAVTTGGNHYILTCRPYVCPYVRTSSPTFQNQPNKTNLYSSTDDCGLAEWIIIDSVFFFFFFYLRTAMPFLLILNGFSYNDAVALGKEI